MRKLSLLSGFILALAMMVPACSSGDDDDDDDDIVVTPDADTTTPDAGAGTPDAPPAVVNAENLGKPCSQAMPCPGGEDCALLEAGATSGICTVPCTMSGMVDTCGAGNGFPGPGVGYCGLTDQMTGGLSCAVGCGEQNGGDTSCPIGTTCKDLINGNGMGDLCAP